LAGGGFIQSKLADAQRFSVDQVAHCYAAFHANVIGLEEERMEQTRRKARCGNDDASIDQDAPVQLP
jgi:hypothetical protein